jgi:hypothetical protein
MELNLNHKGSIGREQLAEGLDGKIIYDYAQQEKTHQTVLNLIELLPDEALNELLGGYQGDVDNMISSIYEETNTVLHDNISKSNVHSGSFEGQAFLQASIEESFRLTSLAYFILTVLPHFELEAFHIEWARLVEEYRRLNVIAPRGHGKSYFFSYANLLWTLYRYTANTETANVPLDRQMCRETMLFTNEISLAENLLGLVSDELKENDKLTERLYNKNTTNKQSIICKNGAKIIAKSAGSKARGYHPTKIILDDYLNDQVITSAEQNSKYISHFYSVISNCLEPNGQLVVVGTPFSENDLYSDLKKKKYEKGSKKGKKIYTVCEYPAINPKDGSVLAPSRFSWDALMEKRAQFGSTIFSRELLCIPVSEASTIFTPEVLNQMSIGMENYSLVSNIDNFKIKNFDRVVTCVDLSISANIGSDYTVIITLGLLDGKIYIVSIDRFKNKRYNEQITAIQKNYANFTPDTIVVESNGFQRVMSDIASDLGLPIKKFQTGNNKKDLYFGLPAVAVLMERDQIKLPTVDNVNGRGIQEVLKREFSNISFNEHNAKLENVGGNDDIAHCLWFGVVELLSTNSGERSSILDFMTI